MRSKIQILLFAFVITILLLLCSCEQGESAQNNHLATAAGDVSISEICASNKTSIAAADGSYYDWVELHNKSDKEVSLNGFALSDNEENPRKWIFPQDSVIAPDGYLVVFCSKLDKAENGELHTNFKISSSGETVLLYDNNSGVIASRIEYKEGIDDISLGKDEETGETVFFSYPTPNEKNVSDHYSDIETLIKEKYTIYINECCGDNNGTVTDKDGDCPDWAEIYNYGDKPVSLSGMFLSDNEASFKYCFPGKAIIEPKSYFTILLSGKKYDYDGSELHADFSIGSADTALTLFTPDKAVLDSMQIGEMQRGVSMGRNSQGEVVYFTKATPAAENSEQYFDTLAEAVSLSNRGLWVSEVMAISCSREDVCSYTDDWIELYNGSNSAINLNGYGLSDDLDDLYSFKFGNTVINAGEYLVVTLNGTNDPANLTAAFKLSNCGETVYITSPDGSIIDDFSYGRQVNGVTSGRSGTQSDERYYFKTPTPSQANSTGFKKVTPLPEFSKSELYVTPGESIELSAQGDCKIYYTTDGTQPTQSSAIYSAPIKINDGTIIRAACYADDAICGGVASHTYITEEKHDIPVVCLCSDPDGLFGYNRGIFADGPGKTEPSPYKGANFWKDWEREIHFEYYETDGAMAVDFNAGLRVFGAFSRANAQKSMSIHLREAYGNGSVTYPFFKDNELHEFSDFVLRSGGQDCYMSKLRDSFYVNLIKGQMDMDYMDYQPVAVYMNGKYYGLYNLREKVNENYLYNHGRISSKDVDIIKTDYTVQSGSRARYSELLNYVRTHDLSIDENYQYVCSQVDIQEMINYYIIETFVVNSDSGNIKVYRGYGDDDKWRWVLFDLDMSLFNKSYQWDMIEEIFSSGSNFYDTTLLRALKQNPDFREQFVTSYANALNTTFAPERTSKMLREMASVIESEIPRQASRWGAPSVDSWNNHLNNIESRIAERVRLSKQYLKSNFNLSDAKMRELFPN